MVAISYSTANVMVPWWPMMSWLSVSTLWQIYL